MKASQFRESLPTGQRAVFNLLFDGEWHDGWEFYDVHIAGGTSGNQRKNELRRRMVADGVGDIEKHRVPGKPYPQFRMVLCVDVCDGPDCFRCDMDEHESTQFSGTQAVMAI